MRLRPSATPVSATEVLSAPFRLLVRQRYAAEDAQRMCLLMYLSSISIEPLANSDSISALSPVTLLVADSSAVLLLEAVACTDVSAATVGSVCESVGMSLRRDDPAYVRSRLVSSSARERLALPLRMSVAASFSSLGAADGATVVAMVLRLFGSDATAQSHRGTGAWNYARHRGLLRLVRRGGL